jgi:HPt (histidine-containing phosphotransfer) domain-containing protein
VGSLDAVVRAWVRDKKLEESLPHRRTHAQGHPASDTRSGQDRRAASDRRIGRQTSKIEEIAGLHMRKMLKRVGGDEEACLHVLRSFATNARPLLEAVRAVNEDTLADYVITVHGIKGASRGICADAVAARAEALEKAARDGNFSFVSANNPAFLEVAWQLVTDIEKMLGKMAAESHKPKKNKPDKEVLSKLLAACEDYDLDKVDAVMSELEGYEYKSGGEFVAWLRTSVDQMHFAEIKEKILASAKKPAVLT